MDKRRGATYLITKGWCGRVGKTDHGYHDVSVLRSANRRSLCHAKTIASKLHLFFYLPLFNSVPPPHPPKYWKSISPFTLATNRTYTICSSFPISQFTSLTCVLHAPFIIHVLDKENTNHHAVFCTPLLQNSLTPRFSHDLTCDPHRHSSK